MFKSYWIGLLGCIMIISSTVFGSTITADQNGNWNQTTTWDQDAVPGCFDTIVIPAGITVTITVTVDLTACPPVYILVEGTLTFQTGKKLDLPDGSVVYIAPGGSLSGGGGGGNSNWITIAGASYWTAGDGNLTGPAILCQNCALPIELVEFTVELHEGAVSLHWKTASEQENDFFWIQRSRDGLTWEDIIWVDGAGNSSSAVNYAERDNNPYLGLSYYRLKQVDMDGAFTYSPVRVVSNGNFYSDQQLLVLSSASATQHSVVIYFSEPLEGEVQLFIAGMNGSVLFAETVMADNQNWIAVTLDRAIAAGIYVVKANYEIDRAFFQ